MTQIMSACDAEEGGSAPDLPLIGPEGQGPFCRLGAWTRYEQKVFRRKPRARDHRSVVRHYKRRPGGGRCLN